MIIMTEVELQGFESMSFDVIMGLGTEEITDKGSEFAAKSLLYNFGIKDFSICLGRGSNQPGRLNIGAPIPLPNGLHYESHPVVGNGAWTLQFGGIDKDKSKVGTEGECSGKPGCYALVDSGTSLITLPDRLLKKLSSELPEIREDCSNYNLLPNIYIELSGKVLMLPPQIYVIQMKDYEEYAEFSSPAAEDEPEGAEEGEAEADAAQASEQAAQGTEQQAAGEEGAAQQAGEQVAEQAQTAQARTTASDTA